MVRLNSLWEPATQLDSEISQFQGNWHNQPTLVVTLCVWREKKKKKKFLILFVKLRQNWTSVMKNIILTSSAGIKDASYVISSLLMSSAATLNKLSNWLRMLTVILCAGADNFIPPNSLTACSWLAVATRWPEDKQLHFAISLYVTSLKVDWLYVAWTKRSKIRPLSILTAALVTKAKNIKR